MIINKASWAIIEIIIFSSFAEIKRIYYRKADTEHINEIICVAQTKRGEFKIFRYQIDSKCLERAFVILSKAISHYSESRITLINT